MQLLHDPGEDAQVPLRAAELVAWGLTGSVLLARRPDLSFGWIFAIGAVVELLYLGLGVPASIAFDEGNGSPLRLWAYSLSGIQWVPDVLTGLIFCRFPSGFPADRRWAILDRTIRWGVVAAAIAGVLEDWSSHEAIGTTERFIDHTPIPGIASGLLVAIPSSSCWRVSRASASSCAGTAPVISSVGNSHGWRLVPPSTSSPGLSLSQDGSRCGSWSRSSSWCRSPCSYRSCAMACGRSTRSCGGPQRYTSPRDRRRRRRGACQRRRCCGSLCRRTARGRVLASYGEATAGHEAWQLVHEGQRHRRAGRCTTASGTPRSGPGPQVLATMAQLVAGSVHAPKR